MPRCCSRIVDEFKPSYASILVSADLQDAVEALEQGPLLSSITGWCSVCRAPYLLTEALPMFPSPSAHHAHMIVASRRMGAAISR